MSQPIAQLEDLCVDLGGRRVLDRVSLGVEERDYLAIIGPNGGGKSTLLRVLLGLQRPTSGRVLLWGEPPGTRRHRIGYVPQHAHFQRSFPATVREVVAMGRLYDRSLFARLRPADLRRVDEELERLGLADKRGAQASELSGGERQRVLIARALCAEPELLLLDEPTASLDAGSAGRVYELLDELNAQLPIVLVSHDLTAVAQRVRAIGCLNQRLHYHGGREISAEVIQQTYGCPVDLIAHGHPHRVLAVHGAGEQHQ